MAGSWLVSDTAHCACETLFTRFAACGGEGRGGVRGGKVGIQSRYGAGHREQSAAKLLSP